MRGADGEDAAVASRGVSIEATIVGGDTAGGLDGAAAAGAGCALDGAVAVGAGCGFDGAASVDAGCGFELAGS